MASLPILTVLEHSQVSPPPATVTNTFLPLTFFDIIYLLRSPIHSLLFYDLPLTKTQFLQTILPNLKHSLSITLQHFPPYAGNLIVFPNRSRHPEIRYIEGDDSVNVTFAECDLDFDHLSGYHPRNCDKFYHLIPLLGECRKTSSDDDSVKIPVFALQVTIFPDRGVSVGMSIHHALADATTQFSFLNAWTSISRCGTDESFLANGSVPVYERLVNHPELDEKFLDLIKLQTFDENYQLPKLSGPTDKVRATFVVTRTFINVLKKHVSTKLPTLPYVSSFTVACAYIWCLLARSRNNNDVDRQLLAIPIDCRTRLDPPLPAAYFGNCIWGCIVSAETNLLTRKQGFTTAAKLIGENLHKLLMDEGGILNDAGDTLKDLLSDGIPTSMMSISGSPKLKVYGMDYGWGKPRKVEKISLDYGASISVDAGKESDQDMEIGVCLTDTQMQAFVRNFNLGLEPYV